MVRSESADVQRALEALRPFGPVLCMKLYRLKLDPAPPLPIIPCLDHEAMLHQTVAPHAAAYVQEDASGDLHEVVFTPGQRRVELDTVSTWGEGSEQSRGRLIALLAAQPGYRVRVQRLSRWRGDRRVAGACRAQVSLRDVLLGEDIEAVKAAIGRLQTVGTLMEKQSRVASWAVRTVTTPILASAGVVTYQVLGMFTARLSENGVSALRYAVLSMMGIAFLYYGLKAVQLTEMSNRVWKRAAEYSLILAERQRLARTP
ncbi:MAG: hypothetical protein HW394_727 [Acidobacteria bacterium]|nr:hypothetical protein [Acidobacteriota bacterium]